MVVWCRHLWLTAVTAVLLAWTYGVHLCQATNSPGLVLAPAQVQRQPSYAVQRMLVVGGSELAYRLLVFVLLDGWSDIQTRTTNTDGFTKAPLESWVDLLQSG